MKTNITQSVQYPNGFEFTINEYYNIGKTNFNEKTDKFERYRLSEGSNMTVMQNQKKKNNNLTTYQSEEILTETLFDLSNASVMSYQT